MYSRRLALLSSILLFCLVASNSEKLCRDVTVGNPVKVNCVSHDTTRTFTNGSNIIWKTKVGDIDLHRLR